MTGDERDLPQAAPPEAAAAETTPTEVAAAATAPERPSARHRGRPAGLSPWRWLGLDLAVAVVLAGAGGGLVALAHQGATTVVSQSAVVTTALWPVTAPATGTVATVDAALGQRVRAGAVLATLALAGGGTKDLTAPTAGTVAALEAVPGERVAAGTSVATVVPAGRMEVVAMVAEQAIRHVHIGQSATVSLAVDPGHSLDGRVRAIWPQSAQAYIGQTGMPAPPAQEFLKQTALVPVAVSLDGEPAGLAVGESAEVTIHVGG
jgi:multidrug resistance efflux pump